MHKILVINSVLINQIKKQTNPKPNKTPTLFSLSSNTKPILKARTARWEAQARNSSDFV